MTVKGREKGGAVPQGVVGRLPIYFRYLSELEHQGIERISSAQLGKALDFTAAQIRSDLSYFGSFGQQGYGYNVQDLLKQVRLILGLNKNYSMILIGAGNLGKAIACYSGFKMQGFEINAIFDIDPHLVGNFLEGTTIQHVDKLEDYLKENHVDVAILATPKNASQSMADLLGKSDVESIWNFSPAHLTVPDNVIVENIHLTDSLYGLVFRLNENREIRKQG
ncbi:MAG: redox-sensing transcriptional repressor Rex [Bacillota bacterium]|nr:redox-sensing transcriptional repressor Rex [Bacillota bacterium]HHU60396.1 redox-sensing transcriptional repressor Rex [Natronincola sp.]